MKWFCRCAISLIGSSMVLPVFADQYPERPIRFVLPIAPGVTTDIVSRIVAQKLQERLGKCVVIENRPGAANIIGRELVSRAEPDGYTIPIATSGHATNPSIYAKLPYDSLNDFSPVVHLSNTPNVFAVNPTVPFKHIRELVEYARANPGKVS